MSYAPKVRQFSAAMFIIVVMCFGVGNLHAQYTYVSGDPAVLANWTGAPANFNTGTFTITSAAAQPGAWTLGAGATLTMGMGGTLTVAAGQTLTVNGVLNLNGTGNQIDIPSSTIVLGPSSTIAGAGLIKADNFGRVRMQATTLNPANYASAWIYNLIVDCTANVTYPTSLTVGNGGLQLANTGNFVAGCPTSLTIVNGAGVSQTGTGKINIGGCGNSLIMQDDNLDGNHYVPGMNNLIIDGGVGGVNLTNTLDICNLGYTSGALNINSTGNLIGTLCGGIIVPAGRTLNINNGGRVTVLPGKYFNNDGTVNVNAGGALVLDADAGSNGVVGGANPITYAGATSILRYIVSAGTVPAKLAGPELPTPTMPGRVEIIRTGANVVQIDKTTTINGGVDVQSGFLDVVASGNVTLGGASQVQSGAYFRALASSTVSGGANLTIQGGGTLAFGLNPTAAWTGTPTYNALSTLLYDNTTRTTGNELPALMTGNVTVFGSASAITLGANSQINGTFSMPATPNNATFTIPSPRILTIGSGSNTIGLGANFIVSAGAADCIISGAGNLTNNGTMTVNGTLTLDGTGVFNPASTTSPTYIAGSVLRYIGTNPSYTTSMEFPSVGVSNLVINRAVAGNTIILQNAKTVSVNATITQGILQTSAVGASLTHTITGNLVVAANGRLRVQENSVVNVAGTTTYSAAAATLEYAGTTSKALTGGELPAAMGGTVIINNSGGVTLNAAKTINTLNFTVGRLISGGFGTVVGASLTGGSGTSYYDCAGGGTLSLVFPAGLTAGPFTFPLGVGAGFYRPITLFTTTMSGLGSVTTSVFAGAPGGGATDGGGFVGIATVPEYWSVQGANLLSSRMRPSRTPTVLPGTARLGYSSTVNGTYNNQTATVNSPGSGDMQSTLALGAGFVAIGTGPAATSDIVAAPYTYTSPITLAQFGAAANLGAVNAGSISLFDFNVRDLGGDGLPTQLNTLNFTLNDPSGQLNQIALYDGVTPVGTPITAVNGALSFTGLTLNIADLTTKTLSLRCTFKSNVTDNANVQFTITSAVANVATSTFAAFPAVASSVAGNDNRVSVVATALSFPNAVGNQIVNTNFSPSVDVRAVDVNNNLDVDVTGTMTITGAPVPVSAGGSVVLTAGVGVGVFNALQMAGIGGGNVLTATLGGLTGVSAAFTVTTIPVYWGCTIPSVPPALPVLGIGGRNMNFNSVLLNGISNTLTNVPVGTPINITGNWSMNWPGGVYCPGCVVQMYVGIGGGSGIAGNGSSATGFTYCLGSGVYNGSSGSFAYTFNAPAKPGIYYISQSWTLHYYCNPHPVGFSNDPTNAIAVIQVVDPIPPSSCDQADIIQTPAFVYPTNIPYATYTGAMSSANPAVWSFRVRDYGTIPSQGDVDNKPTQVASIGINVNDPNGVLQEIALYNGAGLIETQTVSGSGLVTFSSPAVAANIIAPDNGTFDVTVRARFRTTPLTQPMDNQNFSFSINQANVVLAATATSTQKTAFALVGPSSTAGNDNRVSVTASQLLFQAQPPASTPVGVPMASAVVVRAVDGNNNIDLDYGAPNVTIAHPNLIGTPISVAPMAGVATFPLFTFNNLVVAGTLAASSGILTAVNSSAFDIIPATFHFKLPSGNANTLTNWQLAGFPLINPAAIGLPGATYVVGSAAQDPAAANITAPLTINPNSTFLVNGTSGGSTLGVLAGQTLTNNGTLSIQGGARLLLTDDGTIAPASANPVFFAATTATLEYAGAGALNRTTNSQEFPSPLPARLVVSRTMGAFTLSLDASKTVMGEFQKNAAGTMVVGAGQALDLQGGTYYSGGALNLNGTGVLTVPASGTFLITGGSLNLAGTGTATIAGGFSSQGGAVNIGTSTLSLGGAINFGAGTVTPSAGFGTLDINGTGAISGVLGGGVQFGQFTMNRANQVLTLAPGVNLRAVNLSLLNGIIRTSAPADYVDVATTLTASGSATTYIEGKLRQPFPGILNNAGTFDFPLGKGGVYLPIRFQNVTSNSAVVQAEAFNVGSGGASGVGFSSISTTEYWQTSLQGGTFTSALVQLSRPTPALLAAAVVGHSATQTGSYTGIGGSVTPPNVLSAIPVLSANRFFALGVLSNVFYYFSGPAENVTSWNSDVLGVGAPATDFITGGTTFIVPSGKNAAFGANQTFGAAVTTLVNGGGTLSVQNGSTLGVGIFRVAAGGTLALTDSAKINAPSGVNYLGQTAQLLYQNPVNRVATANEFPATMPGSVIVSNGTVTLETTPTVRNITIQGALALKNSTLDFGKDSTRLRIEGALSFNPSQFKTNLTHGLTIAGSGAITGAINFSNNTLGWLTMQRNGVTMTLGDSLLVGSQLSLLGGNIAPPSGKNLLLANSADTALQGGSFSSFVSGIFARALPPNLTPADAKTHFYPIGKGATYLPLTLLNATTGSVTPNVAAEAFNTGSGGAVALGVNGALSSSEHWRVQPLSGNFAGAQIGLLRATPPFTDNNSIVVSTSKTGLYYGASTSLLPIAQGTSLVSNSLGIAAERFYSTVAPAPGSPRIIGFSPSVGGEQSGLTITGTNLTNVNVVAIGGIPVANFQVLNSTTINVVVGAVASGPIQIGSPTGGAASDSTFTFIPAPRIFNAAPNPAGLGVPITINGENFTNTNFLSIGGVMIPQNQFAVAMGGNAITTTVPINAANHIVTIATLGGTAVSTNALVLLPPPTIMSMTPAIASTGQTILLFGQNFVGVQSVRFGATSAQFTVNSPTRITVTVPARLTTGATQVFITVQAGNGTATTATQFAYAEFPLGPISGIDPLRIVVISEIKDKITTLGGRVRVTGANLELIQRITLTTSVGATTGSYILSSSAAMTVLIPTTGLLEGSTATLSSAPVLLDVLGAYNRVVINNAFTVLGVPKVLTVSPADADGGQEITLSGTGMNLVTGITIGGTVATFRIIDSTRIVVVVPYTLSSDSLRIPAAGAIGITSQGGVISTAATIVNSALAGGQPIITGFTPQSGAPGTEVIITGFNLTSVRDVFIGGLPVSSFVINSPTRITVVLSTSASARAAGNINLRTAFGEVVSRTAFTFPQSLEADVNTANTIISELGGDPSRISFATVNNRITVLRLSGAGLRGPIPASISTLTELRELDLSNNFLSSTLPTTFVALTKLERLNLSNNLLTGVLAPGVVCAFRNLRFMDVSRNNLTGEIPVCIAELDRIETLNLSYNRFTSLLPWQLGAMVSLTELRVSNNQLTGPLPLELGTGGVRVKAKQVAQVSGASTVQVIDVSNNAFTGSIPDEWGNISLLRELSAVNCGLTGTLPESIRNWRGINTLRLANNRLSGSIPNFYAGSLREFSIDNNRFSGALPESFGQASALRLLSAVSNRLTLLPEMSAARRLDTVRLDSNRLEFSSLESVARVTSFSANAQDTVKASDDVVVALGDVVRIPSGIGGRATRYQWFKNGALVRGAADATLVLPSIQLQDVGIYTCRATNNLVPSLTLVTAPVRVTVTSASQNLAAPRLLFPSALSSNIAPRPLLRWSKSAGADSYTVIIARDAALRQGVQSVSLSQPDGGDSVVLAWASAATRGSLLERGVQYYWSVRASSSIGDLLPSWSDTLSFRVVPFGQDLAFSSVNLGRVTIGDSARATGTMVNIGEEALTVESAQVESGLANVFALNVARTLLAKDATATFDVLFKPDRNDTIRANVTVRYSDAVGQGTRSVSIERALVGRGGALLVEPFNPDTVRVGKSSTQSVRITNRSNQALTVNTVRILTPRGVSESPFSIATSDGKFENVRIEAGATTYIPINRSALTRGLKIGTLEVISSADVVQADLQAVARLVLPNDPAVSFQAIASPEQAAPGSAVRVQIVINNFTSDLAKVLVEAAQPEVRLALRFDRQVLVLDNTADAGVRLQRGSSDSNVVVITNQWDLRSRVVASLLCRAVAGSRTVTNLEIINAEWGATSATVRPPWERQVFVEVSEKSTVGTFSTLISNAGGKRLITSASPLPKPLLTLVHPNPANEIVSLSYTLFESASVSLEVLNMKGEVVQTLLPESSRTEGEYSLSSSVRSLPTGTYMVRLQANGETVMTRLDIGR